MQVVAEAIDGAVVANCTIAVRITLSMMVILFITKAIRATVGTERTIKVGETFSIKRIFIAVPVNFAIRIAGTMPVVMTGNVWSRSWASRLNFDDATLGCEAKEYDNKLYNCCFHTRPCPNPT